MISAPEPPLLPPPPLSLPFLLFLLLLLPLDPPLPLALSLPLPRSSLAVVLIDAGVRRALTLWGSGSAPPKRRPCLERIVAAAAAVAAVVVVAAAAFVGARKDYGQWKECGEHHPRRRRRVPRGSRSWRSPLGHRTGRRRLR